MKVLTIGTFDLIHPGHLELLAACRSRADFGWLPGDGDVIVGVNRDEFVQRYKGHPPAQPLAHRIEILEALRGVDAVYVNIGDEFAGQLIDIVRPDIIAIGDDWLDPGHDERRYLRQLGISHGFLEERGIRIEYIPRTRGTSSSALRDAS